jgi:uncharacterized damage-inducible protein DinB
MYAEVVLPPFLHERRSERRLECPAMKVLPLALVALAVPALLFARVQTSAPPPPKAQGFKAEFLANLDDVQEKLVSLAEAIPADKYGWRPTVGVRSVSEVFMHIAGSNYFLSTFVGAEPPKLEGDLEKSVTGKSEVIAELRKSFDHLRGAVNGTRDLEQAVKMFGKPTTHRGVLVTILSHLHEHLGQSVAYARINGIVPPWSID